MSIWGCSSPATYCQPASVAGFIYYRSQEWGLHSPSLASFVYLEFSWTHAPFVFSSIQPYPQLQLIFLFRALLGRRPSPTLWWSMPDFSCCYKLSPFQAHWGRRCHTHLLWLSYLQFKCRVPLPLSLELRAPRPLCYMSFFFSCLFMIQFVFFSLLSLGGVGVWLSRGLWWFVPELSVGVPRAA
jgi:hypothetical protein